MKFAFMSLDFRRFPLAFCFECARYYGFDGVEIFCGRPHCYPNDMTDNDLKEIRSWKKTYGVDIPMLCPDGLNVHLRLTSNNVKERDEAITYYKRHIDMASKIECPRVLAVADHPGYNQDIDTVWKHFSESIRVLADYAKVKGVKLTIEPLTVKESPVITRTDDCVRLLKTLPECELNFLLDVVSPTKGAEPISDYFTKLGRRMNYVHISNTDSSIGDAHYRLENGVIQIEDLFTVLKHWGYRDYVSLELYSEGFFDPEILLANSARILKGIRERLGI